MPETKPMPTPQLAAPSQTFPPARGAPVNEGVTPSAPFAIGSATADELRKPDINWNQSPAQAGDQASTTPPLTAPVSPFGNNRDVSRSKDAIAAGTETVPMQSEQRDMGHGGNKQ